MFDTPALIEHIGILVLDLEDAIARWSSATGYDFSPIARYRTPRYRDESDPTSTDLDARMSFSRQGPPRIELIEVSGRGTHGPDQLGIHHLGFPGTPDPEGRLAGLAELGVGATGISQNAAGRILLCFTDKSALDGIRLEFISPLPGPVVADDGSELWRDPVTGRADLWGPPAD